MAGDNPRPPQTPWMMPYLTVRDAGAAAEFYAKAFGFEKGMQIPGEGGKIMHAEMKWHDCAFMLGPEQEEKVPAAINAKMPFGIYFYVKDVDAAYRRAIAAGCKSATPPADMFWGDRMATVVDPDGHRWTLATNVREFDPSQVPRG
jgi:PhnB protein